MVVLLASRVASIQCCRGSVNSIEKWSCFYEGGSFCHKWSWKKKKVSRTGGGRVGRTQKQQETIDKEGVVGRRVVGKSGVGRTGIQRETKECRARQRVWDGCVFCGGLMIVGSDGGGVSIEQESV
jgi:hypothetical protein